MKPQAASIRGWAGRNAVFGLAALLIGGCFDDHEKRIQWAPDGQRAAILTNEGLFLSDANGRLSPMMLPNVNAVAWLSDSQRLAVATVDDATGTRLAIARIDGNVLTVGRPLYSDSTFVSDIRIAPGDAHLAFTVGYHWEDKDVFLLVAPCDGSVPAAVVSRRAAAYPDWSPDGRALVYFEGTSSGGDELALGTLVRRNVVNEHGKIELAEELVHLAGGLLFDYIRVRCLKDGRVLFNAVEVDLPFAPDDLDAPRFQLFAVEPGRQPTLVRLITRKAQDELSRLWSFFEVSPDERQVLFGTLEGEVYVLTLATGKVQQVQSAERGGGVVAPVWRKEGQFTYVKTLHGEQGRDAEVILWNRGQETVLSKDWTSEFIAQLR